MLRPMVLMAGEILKTPALKDKYGAKAEQYSTLRAGLREVGLAGRLAPGQGRRPVGRAALRHGRKTGEWTAGYEQRKTGGFSIPDNKQNLIACWLIAMYDVTGKPVYRERAENWWRVMNRG